jgi:hypothetical protein
MASGAIAAWRVPSVPSLEHHPRLEICHLAYARWHRSASLSRLIHATPRTAHTGRAAGAAERRAWAPGSSYSARPAGAAAAPGAAWADGGPRQRTRLSRTGRVPAGASGRRAHTLGREARRSPRAGQTLLAGASLATMNAPGAVVAPGLVLTTRRRRRRPRAGCRPRTGGRRGARGPDRHTAGRRAAAAPRAPGTPRRSGRRGCSRRRARR